MNQELKEKLHYYLPHGLICTIKGEPCKGEIHELRSVRNDGLLQLGESGRFGFKQRSVDEVIPHMRPLSSLTQEITVPAYNDGMPFVPTKEIRRIGVNTEYFKLHVEIYLQDNFLLTGVRNHLPFWACQFLFQWHFWIGDQALFETGEIIKIES